MNERERLFHSFLMLSRSPAESNSTYVVDSLDKYLEKYVEAYFILKTYKEKYDQEPEIYREGILVGPCFCGKWPGGVPPLRHWVGLTEEEIEPEAEQSDNYAAFHHGVRFAEAKLKEKNGG
jgi:hypothetical protein